MLSSTPVSCGDTHHLPLEEVEDADSKHCCMGTHLLCTVLSLQGLNPVKLVYDPSAGWLAQITAVAC